MSVPGTPMQGRMTMCAPVVETQFADGPGAAAGVMCGAGVCSVQSMTKCPASPSKPISFPLVSSARTFQVVPYAHNSLGAATEKPPAPCETVAITCSGASTGKSGRKTSFAGPAPRARCGRTFIVVPGGPVHGRIAIGAYVVDTQCSDGPGAGAAVIFGAGFALAQPPYVPVASKNAATNRRNMRCVDRIVPSRYGDARTGASPPSSAPYDSTNTARQSIA